jgi:hypothetical protein
MLTRRCGCAGGPSTFFSLPPLTLQPDPQAIANRGGPANFGSWSRIWRHGRSARQSIANFSSRRHCATGDPDPLAVHEWCAGLSVVDASDNAVIPTGNACLPTMMVVHELHSFLQRMKHRDDARCGDARALSSIKSEERHIGAGSRKIHQVILLFRFGVATCVSAHARLFVMNNRFFACKRLECNS